MLSLLMTGSLAALPFGAAEAAPVDPDNTPGTLVYTPSEDGQTMTISYEVNGARVSYEVPNKNNYLFGGYAGTDDLGRSLYTSNQVGLYGSNGEHYVGLFYFLWQGEHGDSGVFDLQKIKDKYGAAAADPNCGGYGPYGAMHFFGEPLYGYYKASDSWIHRKHAELLCNANVDFLYFDVTNGYIYAENALSMMKELHELNLQGYDAPKVVFYSHDGSGSVVRQVYEKIYAKNMYPDTWLYVDGKPCIVAENNNGNPKDYFTVKLAQWPNEANRQNSWPWMDFTWPQRVFTDQDGNPSAVSVSIAQHSGNTIFSSSSLYGYSENRGRSYHADDMSEAARKAYMEAIEADPTLAYQGLNFQRQWDRAIEADVPYVLVTGWNEWVAQRQNPAAIAWAGSKYPVCFIDLASVEFSRDAEMMRGGYFDNYYMQLIGNIQRLKGTAPVVVQDARHKIDLAGSFEQWEQVVVTYTDPSGDQKDRNGKGFGNQTYKNTSGRNDIVAAKMTHDTQNLYVYVQTADDISAWDSEGAWMQLYVSTGAQETNWYGYDYVINHRADSADTTTVAKYDGETFKTVGTVSYRVEGREMMVQVPLDLLGLTDERAIDLQFKWADSRTAYASMEDFYTEGDVAPLGRLNYVFQTYIPGVTQFPAEESETDRETESETIPADDTPAPTETAKETETQTASGCKSAVAAPTLVTSAVAAAVAVRKRKKSSNL